jgi:hypothetical protein
MNPRQAGVGGASDGRAGHLTGEKNVHSRPAASTIGPAGWRAASQHLRVSRYY